MIRLRTLGCVDLRASDDGVLEGALAQPKRVALLVYLAVARPQGFHRRDRLVALFWPELDDSRARDALSQALRFLRNALGAEVLTMRGVDEVRIDASRVSCDVVAFREAIEGGRPDEALKLYDGDFLDGFYAEQASGFEEWVESERAALRALAADGARQLAEQSGDRASHTLAVAWGRRAAELVPDDERAFRRLLGWLERAGDHAGALQAYEDFARRLRAEYGAEPAPETRAMVESIRRATGRASAAVATPPHSPVFSPVVHRTRPQAPDLEPQGDQLGVGASLSNGRYLIESVLGEGGMATVYLAHDVRHERKVAVKVLRPEVAETVGANHLLREIRIAASLQHPHIVPLFDSGESDSQVFFVMPYVVGESLRARLEREPKLPIDVAMRIARDMADALAYAHRRGVVHRDIKPDNVLLSGDPNTGELHALVADFGVAKAVDASRAKTKDSANATLTALGGVVGTPKYMSPEQASGRGADCRADVYAWGLVTYEMLAHAHPFADRTTVQQLIAAHISETPESLSARRPEVSASLAALVMACLRKDPATRPSDGAGVLGAFDAAGIPATPNDSAVPIPRSRGVLYAMLLLAATVAAGLSWANGWLGPSGATRVAEADRDAANSVRDSTLSRYVVLPFTYDPADTTRLNEVLRLRDRLSRWKDVTVIDPLLVQETLSDSGIRAIDRKVAQRVAKLHGADRYVLGTVTRLSDGRRIEATLANSRDNTILKTFAVRLADDRSSLDSAFSTLADSLLLGGEGIELGGIRASTRSLSALHTFIRGYKAVTEWDLRGADSSFSSAVSSDPQFAEGYLWLATVRVWAEMATETWTFAATEAVKLRSQLAPADQLVADALNARSRDDLVGACGAWKRRTTSVPNEFTSWYGLADCLRTDSAVVRDAGSPSGWRFRTSFNESFMAYRRAFDLQPSIHTGVGRGAYQRARRILLLSTGADIVVGRALPPDTGRFLAYPGLNADTIVLIPYPAQQVREGRPGIVPATLRDAVKQQRRLFYSMASTWAAAFPQSPYALEALALSLELLGDRSALGVLRRARVMAFDPEERIRLAVTEAWLRLKFAIPTDSIEIARVRTLADSIIRENPARTAREPLFLASLAALTGRAELTSAYNQRHAEIAVDGVPPSLARDGYSLLAFASLGGPVDSLRAIELRVERGIDQTVPLEMRVRAHLQWLLQAAALAFPDYRFVSLESLSGTGWAVMDAELALTRRDTSTVRRRLKEIAEARQPLPPEDLTLDALYPEASLLAAVGDDDGAVRRLDPTFGALPNASPGVLAYPARAGALVRSMVLRADLAQRANDPRAARRWAGVVATLWAGADPFLQPTVQRMSRMTLAN